MEFVGEYLKSIRIERNCTIEKLSKELRINQSLIKSIEIDDFPEYLESVYLIGHIRSYANFFDLDADDLIETFKIQTSYNKLDENKTIPKPIKTINLFSFTKTFYFASISIISISFYLMFIRPNNLDLEYAMTPNLPENLQSSLEEIEMNLSLSDEKNKNSKSFFSNNDEMIKKLEYAMTPNLPENLQSSLEEIEMNLSLSEEKNKNSKSFFSNNDEMIKKFEEGYGFANSSSVLASNSKDFFLNDADDKITLHFLNPTWIQLRDIDDKIIISKLMNEGEEYSYNLLDNLNLTAGNAGNIIVSLNGIVKGKVGKVGDVIESFIIDKNFKN
jgi:cytoskeletal protein RodZ